ncbi:MAG TPA: VOC family protein [Pirellulaceae bacterium]|nr:VOC family protein [Pirellulaceae bacterium]
MPKNAIHWFEIPTRDIQRAVRFYNRVLNTEMAAMDMMGCQMAMFPCEQGVGVGGALVQHEQQAPAAQGTLVYLDGGDDLAVPLGKVEAAGGKVAMPKTSIGEHGFCAMFIDTEGNRVGLHSMK